MGKKKGNKNPYCNFCKITGHRQQDCRKDPKNNNNNNNNQNNQNNNKQNNHCNYCGHNGHYEAYCDKKKQDAASSHNSFLMTAPWQISPPQPESLWCKWCNSLHHSTSNCMDYDRQVQIRALLDIDPNICNKCAYKGHTSAVCCNPHPAEKCSLCQRPGHSYLDCIRRNEPEVREYLASLPARASDPVVKKDESTHAVSGALSAFKRKREAVDQTQQACTEFISSLVTATSQKKIEEKCPVREDDILNIMDDVLNSYSGQKFELWGRDVTEVYKAMVMYHVNENVTFYRIGYALHRLEAGFEISCANPTCIGKALIVTPEFQAVSVSTRTGYPRNEPEHAVFLASNCTCGQGFEWKRLHIQEADMTPLYLLQAAHSDPIFNRFTQLQAGIATRDTDLEYEAMLDMEKQRQALIDEQQKSLDKTRSLESREAAIANTEARWRKARFEAQNQAQAKASSQVTAPPAAVSTAAPAAASTAVPESAPLHIQTGAPDRAVSPPVYTPTMQIDEWSIRPTLKERPSKRRAERYSPYSSPPRDKHETGKDGSDKYRVHKHGKDDGPTGGRCHRKSLSGQGVKRDKRSEHTEHSERGGKGGKGGEGGHGGGRGGSSPKGGRPSGAAPSGGPSSGGSAPGETDDDDYVS